MAALNCSFVQRAHSHTRFRPAAGLRRFAKAINDAVTPRASAVVESLESRQLLSAGTDGQSLLSVHDHSPFAPATVEASAAPAGPSQAQALPSSFDLRTSGDVTSVKNQGNCGSCWTFATYGSAESSALVQGLGTLDFSENNLKDWHGFDWGPCDGGNSNISEAYLSRGSGPVSEATDPYHDWDDRGASNPNYPRSQWITQMLRYDTAAEMKSALMTVGALDVSMYWDDASYRDTDSTYYYTGDGTNHDVTLVGWDDNKLTAAPTPGAWLIKNSWGSDWGNGGYFWLSYADSVGAKAGESFGSIVPASTYDNVYYWDDFGDVAGMATSWGMNRFVSQKGETLSAVGFFTEADSAGYTVKIYDNYSGGALSGLLASTTGTETTAGWHTVSLPSAPHLTSGNDFYVVLSLTNGGTYPQAVDFQSLGYDSNSTAAPGQSWYSFDGSSWTDLTIEDPTANFCIKAYTKWDTTSNSAPTDISLSNATVPEGRPIGTVVGAFSSVDPDPGDTFTYSLVSGTGSADNASFTISGNQLKTAAVFDAGVKNSYSIRVRTTDSGGLTFEKSFIITVQPVATITGVTATATSAGSYYNWSYTINGSHFGTQAAYNGNSAFINMQDIMAPAWNAGNTGCAVTFNVTNWSDSQITISGYTGAYGSPSIARPGDGMQLWVANPATGIQSATYSFTLDRASTDIALSSTSIAEQQPVGTSVGAFSTTDPDAGDSFTYSLVGGTGSADNGSFTISGNQLLTAASFDYSLKDSYAIRVRSTDAAGVFYEKTFTINVTSLRKLSSAGISSSLNPADYQIPVTFTATILPAGESTTGAPAGFVYATNEGDTFNLPGICDVAYGANGVFYYQYGVSGTITFNNATFGDPDPSAAKIGYYAITGNVQFTVDGANFGAPVALHGGQASITTSNLARGNHSVAATFLGTTAFVGSTTPALTQVIINNAPTDLDLSGRTVAENRPAGTSIGIFSTTDVDFGDTFTYSLASGSGSTDNASFQIVGNELRTAAPLNYELQNTCSIRVRTTDAAGAFYEKVFTITVTDVNEAPTDITLSNNGAPQHKPAGTVVGTFTTADQDLNDTHTYSLVSGTGSADNSSFTITGNTLKTAAWFDYATKGSYQIRVRSTDSGGLFVEKTFTILVTGVTPQVMSMQVNNDGSAQRSAVNSLVVTFTKAVVLNGNSFQLQNRAGTPIAGITLNRSSSDNKIWTLTFTGIALQYGSLRDGTYKLFVSAANVTDSAGLHPEGDYSKRFYRLYGDCNGDHIVDRSDLAIFRQVLNSPGNYASYLDYDANYSINMAEYTQFRKRLARVLI